MTPARATGLFLLLIGSMSRLAVAGPDSTERANPRFRVKFYTQVMGFGRFAGFQTGNQSVNPDNRVARLNPSEAGLYVRPDLTIQAGKTEFWIKPRLHLDGKNALDRGGWTLANDHATLQLFFQELRARWQISDRIYVQGGRYLKQIGTSIFLNPSNPFIVNTGRLNPKIELVPMDLIELKFSARESWNFSLIANVGHAGVLQYKQPFFTFRPTYGFQVENYGNAHNLGLVLTTDKDRRFHAGFYGQSNLTEATVVWVDVALDRNINRFYPVGGHSTQLLNYEMVNGEQNDKTFFTGLAGISYTLNDGPTLTAEYYFNGKGYTRSEADRLNAMVSSAGTYNFDVTRLLSTMNLGRTLNAGMPYTRRHYVFTQLVQNDLFDRVNVGLRNLYSVDDRSNQVSSLIECDLNDTTELYGLFLKNVGPNQADLTRLLRHQAMIGLIYKF